jgi:AraC-like DNA-binding protein
VTEAGYYPHPPGQGLEAHTHDVYELILVARGTLTNWQEDSTEEFGEGSALLLPPGVEHVRRNEEDERIWIYFLWWTGSQPGFVPDLPPSVADARGRMRRQLDWILEARLNGEDAAMVGALAQTVLYEYRRLANQPRAGLVERFQAYVRDHMAETIRLADLARALSVSKSHLSHAYKDLTGESPMRAVRRMRLEQARHLIAHTTSTLEQVAHEVGFADAYHLSHRFKDRFGIPPSNLRTG